MAGGKNTDRKEKIYRGNLRLAIGCRNALSGMTILASVIYEGPSARDPTSKVRGAMDLRIKVLVKALAL